jgi:hypothetical protein
MLVLVSIVMIGGVGLAIAFDFKGLFKGTL